MEAAMAMRMFWARRKASPQAALNRMNFVVWDFLKMLIGAVLCGLAVSIAAAGLTLLLTPRAEAAIPGATPGDDDKDNSGATPGTLIVGGGCEGVALDATERDWHVRIDGKTIEVRVMQTWILPAEMDGAAVFQVQLPRHATFKKLSAQTANREWAGRMISLPDYEKLSAADYRRLTLSQLLVVRSPEAEITSSPIIGLQSGDTVVVQYTYTIHSHTSNGVDTLELPLQSSDSGSALDNLPFDGLQAIAPTRRPTTPGNVWVEWSGQKPAQLLSVPGESDIERTAGKVAGLSWASPALQPGERLRLSWLM
jgi:hypothetical protein